MHCLTHEEHTAIFAIIIPIKINSTVVSVITNPRSYRTYINVVVTVHAFGVFENSD